MIWTFLELSMDQTGTQPGIYVIKTIGDDDNPTIITGTLVTADDGSPVPDVIARGQDKPAMSYHREHSEMVM